MATVPMDTKIFREHILDQQVKRNRKSQKWHIFQQASEMDFTRKNTTRIIESKSLLLS